MVLKEQRFHSIMDIYAFRVIVHDSDTCYRVLGQMHSLYKPRPGRVKDYIGYDILQGKPAPKEPVLIPVTMIDKHNVANYKGWTVK
jgi:hypothetical protein